MPFRAEPMRQAVRLEISGSMTMPACASASLHTATVNSTKDAFQLWASFLLNVLLPEGSQSGISPTTLLLLVTSHRVIFLNPDLPATAFFQVRSKFFPSGVAAPYPRTNTRRFIGALIVLSVSHQSICFMALFFLNAFKSQVLYLILVSAVVQYKTGIGPTKSECIFQHILLFQVHGSVCKTVKRHVRISLVIDGGRNTPLYHPLYGKDGFNSAGGAHGMSD